MSGYEIKNNKLYPQDNYRGSEVKTYFLSDEELEKYRSGDKERETMAESNYKKLKVKFPDIESLIASVNGISMAQWSINHGVGNSYFYKLKKEYESQTKIDQAIKSESEEPTQELEYADLYVVYDGVEFNEFNSMDEALLHIKTQYNLCTVGNVSLFKEIPFTMNVNVTVGKVEG